MARDLKGSCCCGKIKYQASESRPLWYCHCQQCRKMTGHYMAASQVRLEDVEIHGEPKWHYVSESSRHGFCSDCGSQLFWRNDNNQFLSITAGSVDESSGLDVAGHVFTGEKGDYYEIDEREKRFICWADSIERSHS